MNNTEFEAVQLKVLICPQQARWPRPDVEVTRKGETFAMRGGQWPKLHAVPEEARERVSEAFAEMEAIEADRDLSNEGRARKKKQVAADVIADFQNSKTLEAAKDVVSRLKAKWAEETGLPVRPPSSIGEAMMQAEIRSHLAAMKGSKMDFLSKHAIDPRVAGAILGAPPFLSGLTDTEVGVVKSRIERYVAPEIVKEREVTLKALNEAEQGWQRAIEKIGERAGLIKKAEGSWLDPTISEPAS